MAAPQAAPPAPALADLRGAPVLLPGLVAHWPAVALWGRGGAGAGADTAGPGGAGSHATGECDEFEFTRLRELAGDAGVDAMASADEVFTGDMRSHTPVRLTLGELLDHGARGAGGGGGSGGDSPRDVGVVGTDADGNDVAAAAAAGKTRQCMYLAQSPLWSAAAGDGPLAALLPDVPAPPHHHPHRKKNRQTKQPNHSSHPPVHTAHGVHTHSPHALHSVCLWLSLGGSASSLHFDDFNNVLCVVTAGPRVDLLPHVVDSVSVQWTAAAAAGPHSFSTST
jgi:hypothetical protein